MRGPGMAGLTAGTRGMCAGGSPRGLMGSDNPWRTSGALDGPLQQQNKVNHLLLYIFNFQHRTQLNCIESNE